ncbi:MAG: hypothetical protein HC763_05135 [Hydrococcus sp. CRU_1_1]|nr:hypothetical protein [Hydrococcus sp. CRU_1_1]
MSLSSDRPKRKASLHTVLIISSVVQIIIPVGLTGYFSWRNSQQAVNELAYQSMEKSAIASNKIYTSTLSFPN